MMTTIMEIVRRNHAFTGREHELTVMRHVLIEGDPWRMLHVHGAAGIGKTALLLHFAEQLRDVPVFYVDGKNGFTGPRHFLEELDRVIFAAGISGKDRRSVSSPLPRESAKRLNRLSKEHGRILLMLDGLGSESWQPVDEWLQQTFLPMLSSGVRICSAGRTNLQHWIAKPGWNRLIASLQLEPLQREEWQRYLDSCGIRDVSARERIGRLSGGIPLLLCLAANREMQPSSRSPSTRDEAGMLNLLIETIWRELDLRQDERLLLGLSSLLHRFDQDMLAAMLDEPLSDERFQRFCALPVIRPHSGGGWSVIEGFRQLARAEMRLRMPVTYEKAKERAARAMDLRRTGRRRRIDKLVLEDNDFIQQIVYYGDDAGFTVRPAAEEELPRLMSICERNIRDTPPFKPDHSRQQAYLPQLWNLVPESVLTLADNGRIAGFAASVPVSPPVLELFRSNPATAKLARHPVMAQCDWFFWVMGVDPPMDPRALGFALRNIFLPRLSDANRSVVMCWHPEAVASLPLLGCRPLREADYEMPGGLSFRFFCYDADKAETRPCENIAPERIAAVKQVLEQVHDPRHRELRAYFQAEYIRLTAGSEAERTLALILKSAYMRKRISHEAVARQLNVSPATYYRHLRKLVRHLAETMPLPYASVTK